MLRACDYEVFCFFCSAFARYLALAFFASASEDLEKLDDLPEESDDISLGGTISALQNSARRVVPLPPQLQQRIEKVIRTFAFAFYRLCINQTMVKH